MSRVSVVVSIALAVFLSGCVIVPIPTGCSNCNAGSDSKPRKLERGAVSGVPQRVGFFYAANGDCTSSGLVHMNVKQPPIHGSASFVAIEDYPSFPRGAYYACNKNKISGMSVVYTSADGYTGSDHFSVQGIGPRGKLLTTEYTLTIVPAETRR
jgi:hypothetical protein